MGPKYIASKESERTDAKLDNSDSANEIGYGKSNVANAT